MHFKKITTSLMVLCLAGFAMAQGGGNRGNAEATVKGKKVSINYGRPSLKGRDLLGQMTVGMTWRLGANQATEITTEGNLDINGKTLPAGKYSLWLKKTGDNSFILGFHPDTGIWGVPVRSSGYVAELPMTLSQASDAAEQLTITVAEEGGKGVIKVHWGTALLTGSFGAT